MMNFPRKYFYGLLSATLLIIAQGCAGLPSEPVYTVKRDGIKLIELCETYQIRWEWDSISQVMTLYLEDRTIKVLVGSDIVFVGDDRVILNSPTELVRGKVIVPEDFSAKVFEQKRVSSIPFENYSVSRVRTIVIDAGHGGKDPGAIGISGVYEKDVVLDIAKRVERTLETRGFKVVMTRSTDDFITLNKRTEIASRNNADIFVSIHANSSPSRGVFGMETFTLKDLNEADHNEEQRLRNHYLMFQELQMKRTSADVKSILADMLYLNKQAYADTLGESVLNSATRLAKVGDRGLKESRFFVLRNTLVPAVLVEVGFLTNPKEEKMLKTTSHRQRLAYGVAMGIIDYIDGR